jgi:hypothetical protein
MRDFLKLFYTTCSLPFMQIFSDQISLKRPKLNGTGTHVVNFIFSLSSSECWLRNSTEVEGVSGSQGALGVHLALTWWHLMR